MALKKNSIWLAFGEVMQFAGVILLESKYFRHESTLQHVCWGSWVTRDIKTWGEVKYRLV